MPIYSYLLPFMAFFYLPLCAQTSVNYAVSIQAEVQENPAQITLKFNQDSYANAYFVYRKLASATNWGPVLANLSATDSIFIDTTVSVGQSYEYRILKQAQAGSNNFTGYGYINAGIKLPAIEQRGGIILLVDSTLSQALTLEINRLVQDLKGDGWNVYIHNIPPSMPVPAVKNIIYNDYILQPQANKTLLLLGHVPVPYAGQIYPDGHPNHEGAWPADTYYADMNGLWTDNVINVTATFDTRNHNVPGDGKFDQSLFVDLELEVGRVDMSNLPSFTSNEIELTRRYLNKNHQFRHKKIEVKRQAVIDDNFSNYAEAFAANGYRNFPTFFGTAFVQDADYVTSLKNDSYLWSYGCGAGTHTSCSGVANTNTFVNDSLASVFTMLFGSYFGDWDRNDNFLRAALASGQTLTNCWGGRPNYYFHHMALGKHIGYSTLLSQNNTNLYYAGLTSQWIHSALMGDPSLRMHVVAPVQQMTLDTLDQAVLVQWTASTDSIVDYYIYRKSLLDNDFQRIYTASPSDSSYVDSCMASGTYIYMIRAAVLEKSASGTYYNLSQGLFDTILVNNNPVTASYSFNLVDSTVIFTNGSTEATQYSWNFGDSTYSTAINPQHSYSQNGSYMVQLIANNNCTVDTFTQQIDIVVFTPILHVSTGNVLIYPNPVDDFIYIDTRNLEGPFTISLYNSFGQLLMRSIRSEPTTKLSMKKYAIGNYFLKFKNKEGSVQFKLSKT